MESVLLVTLMFAETSETLLTSRHHHIIIEEAFYPSPSPQLSGNTSLCIHPTPRHTATLYLASSHYLPLHLYGFGMSDSSRCCLFTPLQLTDPAQQAPNQPRPYPGNYMANGGAPSGPAPGAVPLLPNQGRVIQQGSVRVLCIADVRGENDVEAVGLRNLTDTTQEICSR